MKELLKQHKKYSLIDVADDFTKKLVGNFKAGCKVKIIWGKEFKGCTDIGYAFSLPICDETIDNDFFIHVPQPQNPNGIGDAPPQWNHVNCLLLNEYVKKIILT